MFNKGNMSKMLKQAQQMQKQIENVQNELDDLQISGDSGGGLINVTVNGKMELLNCKIKDEVLKEEKDLIISAVNNALSKAQAESQSRMNTATGGMLGGMKLPGM